MGLNFIHGSFVTVTLNCVCVQNDDSAPKMLHYVSLCKTSSPAQVMTLHKSMATHFLLTQRWLLLAQLTEYLELHGVCRANQSTEYGVLNVLYITLDETMYRSA